MTSLENSTDNRVVSGCEGCLDKHVILRIYYSV